MPAQAKATSSIKSGMTGDAFLAGPLGGTPPKKTVEQIDKVNTPGK